MISYLCSHWWGPVLFVLSASLVSLYPYALGVLRRMLSSGSRTFSAGLSSRKWDAAKSLETRTRTQLPQQAPEVTRPAFDRGNNHPGLIPWV